MLNVAGLGTAILIGFVLGLQFGDRGRRLPPVPDNTLAVVQLVDTVAAADTLQTEPQAAEAPEPSSSKKDIARGAEYLMAHNRWNRDEMEKIPALAGLWDAVNTYSLDEIRAYNDVFGSTPLTTIVEGLEKKPKNGFYAARNDHVITLSTYVKSLR